MKINFEEINERLLGNYLSTLEQWLPQGRKIGPNWCVGSLAGERGDSLKIHVRKGVWKDFASGEKGGSDPISLYAALNNLTQAEAAKRLGGTQTMITTRRSQPIIPEDDGFTPVTDPAEDMPDHGLGCNPGHEYLTADGRVLGYVVRSNFQGEKTFRPRTPWHDRDGVVVWRWKGFNYPRPLYGLNLLASMPRAVVVVVEGEKCADALRRLNPTTPVIAWPGGSGGVSYVDWEPIKGRRVVLWPDADEPGRKAMAIIAAKLAPLGCQVKLVHPPGDAPKGWDVADAIEAGATHEDIMAILAAAKPVTDEPMLLARTVTTTQAARTHDGDAVQRVEVREEFAPMPRGDHVKYGLQLGAGGKYVPCLDSLRRIMEIHEHWKGRIWWDTFLERIQTDIRGTVEAWTDRHSRDACCWMQSVFELPTVSSDRVHEAVLTVSDRNERNILTEWLTNLTWDGVARMASLMPTGFGTVADNYHVRVGECWLLSLVARAMRPGCKVDTMPVFEGSQGMGKSSVLAILGGDWFGECHEDFGSKDFVLSLKGKWLIEVAEMHSFKRQDVDRLKGIMSTCIDRVRVPYGRMTEDHPRQSVFAGTTNRDDWQQDDTGARRFWAVRCGFLNLDWIRDNRDQLFAEAVARFKAGETWWSVPSAAAAAAAEERRPEDPWEQALAEYLDPNRTYSSRELMNHPLQIETENQSQTNAARIGRVLRKLGWVRYEARIDGSNQKRWKLA